ncbi:hypothetical protein BN2475_190157 [Paraburkholderia ribeironis]|uniref:Uncharacterized protein n=1 Tax=Paraburkholderia ribeironis TaxID=1247936 RepID=A0A1N7RVY8_9BURK|nr:hypothetical protein BN2475_190157 [Paraburkholderia ribeironis]
MSRNPHTDFLSLYGTLTLLCHSSPNRAPADCSSQPTYLFAASRFIRAADLLTLHPVTAPLQVQLHRRQPRESPRQRVGAKPI